MRRSQLSRDSPSVFLRLSTYGSGVQVPNEVAVQHLEQAVTHASYLAVVHQLRVQSLKTSRTDQVSLKYFWTTSYCQIVRCVLINLIDGEVISATSKRLFQDGRRLRTGKGRIGIHSLLGWCSPLRILRLDLSTSFVVRRIRRCTAIGHVDYSLSILVVIPASLLASLCLSEKPYYIAL